MAAPAVAAAPLTYDVAVMHSSVRSILDKQGLLWMAPVIMMYEQSVSLSLRNLAKLGQVVQQNDPSHVSFDADRVKYLKKLKALDQLVGADDQVWPAGRVPDDLVQPLFEAVEEEARCAADDTRWAFLCRGRFAFTCKTWYAHSVAAPS